MFDLRIFKVLQFPLGESTTVAIITIAKPIVLPEGYKILINYSPVLGSLIELTQNC